MLCKRATCLRNLDRGRWSQATVNPVADGDRAQEDMDAVIKSIKASLEMRIDYGGQARAERINQQILIASGLLAFIAGFALQSVVLCMAVYAGGLLASAVAIIPPWPYLNKHRITWLPPLPEEDGASSPASTKKKQ